MARTEPATEREMRVLVMTSWYPSADRPTYGVYVREFAHAISLIADVVVLHLDGHQRPSAGRWYSLEQESDDAITEGLPTYRVNWGLVPGILPNLPLRLVAAVRAYRTILKDFHPDILHAHVFSAGLAAVVIGKPTRTPVVITEHSSGFMATRFSQASTWEARIAYRLADAVLPVSRALLEAIEGKGLTGNFHVVPNVVDRHTFHPDPTSGEAIEGSGIPRLLFVGALRSGLGKGLPDLLTACRILHDGGMQVHLTVVGDGPRRPTAEQMARDFDLHDWVVFKGGVDKSSVAQMMRESDLLVAPSTTPETFALPIAEAQACGLPCVATNVGAIPEILNPTVGSLVVPGDPVALAQAIEEALDDRSRWDRDEIAESAFRFEVSRVASTIKGVYVTVIAAPAIGVHHVGRDE